MNKDPCVTFIDAKGVAFVWVGAAIGPAFIAIGMGEAYRGHLAVGVIALILVGFSIRDGVKAIGNGSISDFLAFAIAPAILLVVGIFLAWIGFGGSA